MIAAVAALALGSLAGENVAPTKSELEECTARRFVSSMRTIFRKH